MPTTVQITTVAPSVDAVRALAHRVRAVHPDVTVTALITTPPRPADTGATAIALDSLGDGIEVVHPTDLDPLPEPWTVLLATLSAGELIDVLRPVLLHHVVSRSGQPAVHLDPDVLVLGPLTPLVDRAAATGLAFVARRSVDPPLDGARPNAHDVAAAGPVTLAVVAASAAGRHALWDWSVLAAGVWLDARSGGPVALAAALLARPDVTLVLDDGHASWWNVDHRLVVTHDDGRRTIGAAALRTLDPTGWDRDAPGLLCIDRPSPQRTRLSANPGLADLLLGEAPAPAGEAEPLGIAPGVPYDDRLRDLTSAALAASRHDGQPAPPNPFTDPAEFLTWVDEPVWGGPAGVSRYLLAVRAERSDLQAAFPEVPGRDAPGLRQWARDFGATDASMPPALVPGAEPPARLPFDAASGATAPGVTIAGFLDADLGVGEVARRLVHACELVELTVEPVTYRRTRSRQRDDTPAATPAPLPAGGPHPVNIVCINADTLGAFARDVGTSFFDSRYTIGIWFWETAVLPTRFRGAAELVDELWAASDLVAQALSTTARAPVLRFPLPIVAPALDRRFSASSIGVPAGRPYVVCSYDAMSVPGRKNPIGAIDAFRAAFRDDEGPVLVVKSINGDRRPDDLERARFAARGRSDIVLHDGYLSAGENATLVAEATAMLSLHRSEGFGFNVADAIALRTPVIATRAGGILAFCTDDDTLLVPGHPVEVGPDNAPYEPTDHWTEPDLAVAAGYLRAVVDDPATAAERATHAQARVLRDHHPAATGQWIRDRVLQILAR
jgi:glycosyltransferase involved in cell wall biosynthesis